MARRHIATAALTAASLLAAPAANAAPATAKACSSPGNKVGNPGFESGVWGPWTMSVFGPQPGFSPLVHDDGSGVEHAHSGAWFTFFDGYVDPVDSTWTDFAEQNVTVPAGCRATLTFWLHTDTEETGTTAKDTFFVQLGSTVLHTWSNLDAAPGYQQRSFDVSSFAGQSGTLLFNGTQDASTPTTFTLDDIALTAS